MISLGVMVLSGSFIAYHNMLSAVWPAFLALVLSPLVFPFAMLPAGIFAGIMRVVEKSHPRTSKGMMAASVVYLAALFSAYAALAFMLAPSDRGDVPDSVFAVFAVAAAAAPWALFAARDRANLFFTGLVYMQIAASILTAVLSGVEGFLTPFLGIWVIMLTMLGCQHLYEKFLMKQPTV